MNAEFTSTAEQLENASHYCPNMGRDPPERIVLRDLCETCHGTTALITESGVRATFVRLHMKCAGTRVG
jgi:hypothetical protein